MEDTTWCNLDTTKRTEAQAQALVARRRKIAEEKRKEAEAIEEAVRAAPEAVCEDARCANAVVLGDKYLRQPPRLPAIRQQFGSKPVVCAAYLATCVPGSSPPRATLAIASGTGGLGMGMPSTNNGWLFRPQDFCKGLPLELRYRGCCESNGLASREGHRAKEVPGPQHCFCPTNSLDPRSRDPLGFDRRVPAGGLPQIPRLLQASVCRAGHYFVTYQCAKRLLLPPPEAPASSAAGQRGARGLTVLLATSDHFGHGVFALVQRVLNQVHLARRLRFDRIHAVNMETLEAVAPSKPASLADLLAIDASARAAANAAALRLSA